MDSDKTRAKTFHARIVLVASGLIDSALAAKFGFERRNRDAVGLDATVTTAFAHEVVNDYSFGWIGKLIALAPASFFGATSLIVDNHGDAGYFTDFFLDFLVVVTVVDFHAFGESRIGSVLIRFIGDDDDFLRTFCRNLSRYLRHCHRPVDLLTAGHRNGVVEQNLVRHVHAGRDRRTHCQQTGVVIGSVTDVLEHMLGINERRLAHPARAFATHLRITGGAPVHPLRHKVTTNAGQRHRTLGHERAGAVRTTRTEIRRALHGRFGRVASGELFPFRNPLGKLRIAVTFENTVANGNRDFIGIQRGD